MIDHISPDSGAGPTPVDETALDGNAAAGVLHAVFGRDMTLAMATCDACGAVDDVGGLVAYMRGPGVVLRCRACGSVLLRAVRGRGCHWLDLRGVQSMRIAD